MSLRRVRSALSWLAFGSAIAGWYLFLAPAALGGKTSYVVIQGTSMNPTYETGDLVLVRRQASYRIGDVAAFEVSMGERTNVVIHRIIDELPSGGLVLQGDNRDLPDPWHPTISEVVGTPFADVPRFGLLAARLAADPLLLGALCGVLAGLSAALGPPGSRPPKPVRVPSRI